MYDMEINLIGKSDKNKTRSRGVNPGADSVYAEDIELANVKLRQLGNFLRNQIRIFRKKYEEEDIGFQTVAVCSKMINNSEEKIANYLSMIIVNERVHGRYMKIRRVKERQEEKLSTATTVWTRRFSPTITEITSYNRAKYLAGSLVNVFEHQWQEMYTSARKKLIARVTEKDIIECLGNTLKYCYHRCQDFAWNQSALMLQCLTMSTLYSIDNCPPVIRLRIKELQKVSASYTLPFIQKSVRQCILSQLSLRMVVKTHNTQKPPLRTFLDLCTEVTWLMQCQDPPIVLDFTEENSAIKFKPYTSAGEEFVYTVWPAVLLHDSGLIVSKGVAQFFDSKTENFTQEDE